MFRGLLVDEIQELYELFSAVAFCRLGDDFSRSSIQCCIEVSSAVSFVVRGCTAEELISSFLFKLCL